MSAADYRKIKEQKTQEAAREVAEIRMEGHNARRELTCAQKMVTAMVNDYISTELEKEKARSNQREYLLKQLGAAAATGNFQEMDRIKQELDNL